MRTKSFGMIAISAVLLAVAITAVAFGPANFAGLSNPGTNPDDGTNQSQSDAPIGTPTWGVGDTWTYETKESWRALDDVYPSVTWSLTKTVVSADGGAYNVSLQGSFRIPGFVDLMGAEMPSTIDGGHIRSVFKNATIEGYAWYRASDLAKLKDVRMIEIDNSFETHSGTYEASYLARIETTYEPALNLWSFPLGENETWTVTSNATIHAAIAWRVVGPDVRWEAGQNFTATRPIRLVLSSGESEDVTTPAGTFASIPVRIGSVPVVRGADEHLDLVLDLGDDEMLERVTFWFSGSAKNVVMASVLLGGDRVDAVLTSYDVG